MKKTVSVLFSLGILLFLMTATGFAQQYHIMYSGTDFKGYTDTVSWTGWSGGVFSTDSGAWLSCGVNFPDSADGMQVQRVSISVRKNNSNNFRVILQKVDRWSGNVTWTAELTTAVLSTSGNVQFVNIPKSQMTAPGIDSDRFAWYLMINYYAGVGSSDLYLKTVTIRYF